MSTRLVVGVFSPSVLLRVAERSGRLSEDGLAVTEVPVTSSPAQFRSLLEGDLDVALTSPDNVLAYRYCPDNPLGATADVAILTAVDRGLGLGLYARPGASASNLRDARWGVDVPTSGFAFGMYALAEHLGLARGEYEVMALGSTPRRLGALLSGDCAATMLNAGNELKAEYAGCLRLARLVDVCAPYLGTVLAAAREPSPAAWALADALTATARRIGSGELDAMAEREARKALDLSGEQAARYVERLKSQDEGLVPDGAVDLASLTTLAALRRRYAPCVADGVDLLAPALDPSSGLVAARATPAYEPEG